MFHLPRRHWEDWVQGRTGPRILHFSQLNYFPVGRKISSSTIILVFIRHYDSLDVTGLTFSETIRGRKLQRMRITKTDKKGRQTFQSAKFRWNNTWAASFPGNANSQHWSLWQYKYSCLLYMTEWEQWTLMPVLQEVKCWGFFVWDRVSYAIFLMLPVGWAVFHKYISFTAVHKSKREH